VCYIARTENNVLKEKVRELEQRCKVLTVENESLKVEVELYRREMGQSGAATVPSTTSTSTSTSLAIGSANHNKTEPAQDLDHFLKSGDGTYTKSKEIVFDKLHGIYNPSCCSLSYDDTILATGGVDQTVALVQWGPALGGTPDATAAIVKENVVRVACGAPVVAVEFARTRRLPFCVAGCMDGTVHVIHIETLPTGGLVTKEIAAGTIKHGRYVRTIAWASDDTLFATSSADGHVQVHKIVWNGLEIENIRIEKLQTLNLSAPVESMCFHKGTLVCYARGTPFLSYFDLSKDFELTKLNLNRGPGFAAAFDHVSFCVMHMVPRGDYLALATDTSRNIIIEFETGKQIRNLYGHTNDGFSQPKVAWSRNGQYLYGNTQDGSSMVVWDISTASIVDRLEGHDNPIRDLFSSPTSDTVITTSFDKKTLIWLTPLE
jgi:WD40 repeat protein